MIARGVGKWILWRLARGAGRLAMFAVEAAKALFWISGRLYGRGYDLVATDERYATPLVETRPDLTNTADPAP